jgi:hypothetical protein
MVAPDARHPRRSQAEIPLIDLSEFGRPPLIEDLNRALAEVEAPGERKILNFPDITLERAADITPTL